MIHRRIQALIRDRLAHIPAVALLGPRQVGKTTLAQTVAEGRNSVYLDLESPLDREKLSDPIFYLSGHENELVILDEVQRMPDGRQEDVAARLVGLGFECEAVSVFLGDVVFAEIVDGFAQALDGIVGAAASIGLDTFTASPQNEYLGTEFCAEIHGAHRFLNGVRANFWVVGGKGPVTKNGMEK